MTFYGMMCIYINIYIYVYNIILTHHQLKIKITGISIVMKVDKDFFLHCLATCFDISCNETIINASMRYNMQTKQMVS